MNAIAQFRLCKLSNEELIQIIDEQTDQIFTSGKIPPRHIPALPEKDYDLLIGELILRFRELIAKPALTNTIQDIIPFEKALELKEQGVNQENAIFYYAYTPKLSIIELTIKYNKYLYINWRQFVKYEPSNGWLFAAAFFKQNLIIQ